MVDVRERFRSFFHSRQSACAFGRPTGRTKPSPTGPKVEYSYHTERRAFNERDVERHLAGEVSVVAIPLLEDGNCLWAKADIDIFDGSVQQAASPILRQWFRSKSGGWHPIVFFPRPRPADRVRLLLRAEMTRLGHPDCEIFPKQDTASVGNGVNLPFFGDRKGFENFIPLYYNAPIDKWPTLESTGKKAASPAEGDDDSGYWDDAALVAMLDAYKENIPDFDFCPGRLGYMVPCPGNEEGWSDGAMHSSKDAKLSPFAEVFIQNGWPKFKCFHAHCDGGCGCPKKTINDFRSHYDPLRILFDFDEWLWDECEKQGMTGVPNVR